jgi:GNAT superfamily N-acetyltransferase
LYFTKKQCLDDLQNPVLQVFGIKNSNAQIQGFVAAMANGIGFEPMIEYLCVAEANRGQGCGTRLVKFFEDDLQKSLENILCMQRRFDLAYTLTFESISEICIVRGFKRH